MGKKILLKNICGKCIRVDAKLVQIAESIELEIIKDIEQEISNLLREKYIENVGFIDRQVADKIVDDLKSAKKSKKLSQSVE